MNTNSVRYYIAYNYTLCYNRLAEAGRKVLSFFTKLFMKGWLYAKLCGRFVRNVFCLKLRSIAEARSKVPSLKEIKAKAGTINEDGSINVCWDLKKLSKMYPKEQCHLDPELLKRVRIIHYRL